MEVHIPLYFLVVALTGNVYGQNRAPEWDPVAMDKIFDTFTRQVSENTTEGTVLGTLKAVDPEGLTITYYAESQNTVNVNPDTGVITLGRPLDREKGDKKVDIRFFAQDPLQPGSNVRNTIDYAIKLDVQDINDNAPTFQGLPYAASILENQAAGKTILSSVNIIDLDDGYNAEVFVQCESSDAKSTLACEKFGVSNLEQPQPRNYTAHIFTKGMLDYENQTSYLVTLLAWDNGSPPLSSRANILIQVIDQQDSPPEFLNTPINLYTNESIPVGTTIGVIQARDKDQGNPRPVKVVKLPGDDEALFDLVSANSINDIHTYNVITKVELDRETLRGQAVFHVRAIELDNGAETDVTTEEDVLVNIFDINDNGPTFDKDVYNISTSESVRRTNDTQIPGLTMTVKDPDDTSNAQFRVFVESQSFPGAFTVFPEVATSQGPFALAVQDTKFMDYEVLRYRNQMVVVVARELHTAEVRSSTATVYVALLDVNDNSPIFDRPSYSLNITENKGPMFLTTVSATDKDDGLNGKITYSIDHETGNTDITKFFRMDPETGNINLLEAVDYEKNREFTVVISASDAGSPKRTTKVVLNVIVQNVNDVKPRFLLGNYISSVTETSMLLQPAITVQAIDTEEGVVNISYRIVSGNDLRDGLAFIVHATSGVLSLTRNVNFDETPNKRGYFELVIEASDGGHPALTATVTVRVNVRDENNYNPTFTQVVFTANVSELADGGSPVIKVQADDQDTGVNGQLTYSLQGSLDDFEIDPGTGLITVSPRAKLDYSRPVYSLIVFATDKGTPRRRSSSATIIVDIIDKNNKIPVFTEALYTATVSESETMNKMVIQVSANDVDTSSHLDYTILTNTITAKNPLGGSFTNIGLLDYRNSFYIDRDDGEIRIKTKLKYETVAQMDFAVQVEDMSAEPGTRQTATASVNIRILGSSDGTPYFVAPWTEQDPTYYFNIPEESQVPYLITTLVAFDPIGKTPIDNFEESPNVDQGDYFLVDSSTGALTVKRKLDYETLRSRVLPVEVNAISNTGKTALARIRIQIQDLNDNNPFFDTPNYSFDVYENRAFPTLLGRVAAKDPDSGIFGQIEYSLSGQQSNHFQILSSGEIIVSRQGQLDREMRAKYDLTVTATDNVGGSTRNQGSAQMTIYILDENDNVPQFLRKSYKFLTVESAALDTVIGQIQAEDKDAGQNAAIIYTMSCVDPATTQLFALNIYTGVIQVDQSLTGRMRDYRCNVTASDQGKPTRIKTTSLVLQVSSGSNNGIPSILWPPAGYVAKTVYENKPPGQVVGTISAESVAGNITYSFKDSTGNVDSTKFEIDPVTGRVTTREMLDREENNIYELLIYATVEGSLNLTSGAVLRIEVQDENDNHPSFNTGDCDPEIYTSPPFKVYIPENTAVGTNVKMISACDADDPNTIQINYQLLTRAENPEVEQMCENASYFHLVSVNRTRAKIEVLRSLDHDNPKGTRHLLCIQASDAGVVQPGRKKRQTTPYNQLNFTVAYIEINVVDVNDNGPVFPMKEARIAIPEFPSQDYVVTQMLAVDSDSPPLNRVRYSIQNTEFVSIDNQKRNINVAFEINPRTGNIVAKLIRYTQFLGGSFTLLIRAEDDLNSTFTDTMTLTITVIQVGQRLKVTWTIQAGQTGDSDAMDTAKNDLNKAISGRSGWVLVVDELRYHIDNKGRQDYTKLDACFVVLDSSGRTPDTNVVLQEIYRGITNTTSYDPGLCDVETSQGMGGASIYWWVLIALAIAIFVGTLILIIAVLILYARLKQKGKKSTTYMVRE